MNKLMFLLVLIIMVILGTTHRSKTYCLYTETNVYEVVQFNDDSTVVVINKDTKDVFEVIVNYPNYIGVCK